jgi:short-subunit dehydrogenase
MDLLLVARSEGALVELARDLRTPSRTVAVAAVDLGRPDAAEQVAGAARRELGDVDVLVNNAAVEYQRRFHTLTAEELVRLVRVDLLTPVLLSHLVLPAMLQRGYGRIVNVSSIAGRVGFPYTEAYAASKDGLIGFSRALRNDYRRSGVTATAVVLGAVRDTGLGQRTIEETGMQARTAYMVKPERVGRAVVRAVDKGKAEIVVMKGPGRLLKAMLDFSPGFGSRMNRWSGAERYMGLVAEFRERQHATATAAPAAGRDLAPLPRT